MAKLERESQYEWAVRRVEQLLPLVKEDTPEDNPARIELELLSELVSEYSEEHFAIGEPSLVDILKLRMYEMGLSQKGLAELIGISPSRLSDLLSGKCEPTIKTARSISRKLDIDAAIVLGV
jgi:HTH-type transcriptional regulator/antitoxin HigA